MLLSCLEIIRSRRIGAGSLPDMGHLRGDAEKRRIDISGFLKSRSG